MYKDSNGNQINVIGSYLILHYDINDEKTDDYRNALVKALRLLIQLGNGRWVTDLCPTVIAFSATQTGVRKSRKHLILLDDRAPI